MERIIKILALLFVIQAHGGTQVDSPDNWSSVSILSFGNQTFYYGTKDDKGSIDYFFDAPSKGYYTIKALVLAENAGDDSFYYKINKGYRFVWDVLETPRKTPKLRVVSRDIWFAKGINEIRFDVRENHTYISSLYIEKQKSIFPSFSLNKRSTDDLYYSFDFENAEFRAGRLCNLKTVTTCHQLRYEGGLYQELKIDSDIAQDSDKSMRVSLNSGNNYKQFGLKDRAEFTISDQYEIPQLLNENRFYSFSIRLDEHNELPNSNSEISELTTVFRDTVIFQAWQAHDTKKGNTRTPVLAINLTSPVDGKFGLIVDTADDTLPYDPIDHTYSLAYELPDKFALERGKWYQFTVRFQPGSEVGLGAIVIWQNREVIFEQTQDRKFSYDISADVDKGTIQNVFQIRTGAYRGRLNQKITSLRLNIDNIKMGRTLDSVNE